MKRSQKAARIYDVISFEWPIYRPGRKLGIDLLSLKTGDNVLDVGCGTGLNFGLLQHCIGSGGSITGIDASLHMLNQARRRTQARQWANVTLVHADAADMPRTLHDKAHFDAVLFTYSLSIVEDWHAAWARALSLLKPGGRVSVVDLGLPNSTHKIITGLARVASFSGGSDPRRAPWTLVERDTADVTTHTLRRGHIHVAAGTKPLVPTEKGSDKQ